MFSFNRKCSLGCNTYETHYHIKKNVFTHNWSNEIKQLDKISETLEEQTYIMKHLYKLMILDSTLIKRANNDWKEDYKSIPPTTWGSQDP